MKDLSNNDVVAKQESELQAKTQLVRRQHFEHVKYLNSQKASEVLQRVSPTWVGEATSQLDAALYDLDMLSIPKLWMQYGIRGQGINVAVIDTGIDTSHTAFLNQKNLQGLSFLADDTSFADGFGHGTWVAGKVGAQGVGLAPRCSLTCLRTLDASGTGSSKSAADALKWVLDNGSIHLVNMSLGSYTASADEERVLKQLEMAGVLVVCAAGNANTSEPFYPACYDSVLAVAAIDQQSHRANFSNYGPHLAISAPGVDCYSTYLGGQYRKLSGTSMATPIVTGLLALGMSYVLIKNPGMDKKTLRQKVMTTLLQSAKKLGDRVYFGAGGIDALSFINNLAV